LVPYSYVGKKREVSLNGELSEAREVLRSCRNGASGGSTLSLSPPVEQEGMELRTGCADLPASPKWASLDDICREEIFLI
jgi:hypothetical protein